jgi:hypothetical protein
MIDGRALFLTGQGAGRRNLVSLDPRWLTLTHHEDDFSDGLKGWIAFKAIGPPKRYIRARTHGPRLIDHPDKPGARVLQLRKPDDNAADGALWNFPNGVKAKLTLRLLLNGGFGGGSISLCDRSFKPTDGNSERLAIFTIAIAPDGTLGTGPKLALDAWHALEFAWALEDKSCSVSVDGKPALVLNQQHLTGNGISYLHLRSEAEAVDEAGFLIESVSVDTEDPVAPPLTAEQQQGLLDRYIPSYYNAPPERGTGQPSGEGGKAPELVPIG